MWLAALSPALIRGLGPPVGRAVTVAEEIMPGTMEGVV